MSTPGNTAEATTYRQHKAVRPCMVGIEPVYDALVSILLNQHISTLYQAGIKVRWAYKFKKNQRIRTKKYAYVTTL